MSRNINKALLTSYWEAKGLKSVLSRYWSFVNLLEPPYTNLHA